MKRTCGDISHTTDREGTCDVILPADVVAYLIQITLGEKIKKLGEYRWLTGLATVTQYFQVGVVHFLSNNLHQLGPYVVFHMRGRNIGRIMRMKAITKLKLPFQYVELDDYLTSLKNLQTLDLCQTGVLTCLTGLTNLTSLVVENNNAYAVKHLTNLKSLATCSMTTDDDIRGLTSLTLLDIRSQCDVTKITENSLKHLTNLTILLNNSTGIGGTHGHSICLSDVLPNLTKLHDYGGLSSQDIAGLTKLKTLVLGFTSMIGGTVISTLTNLEILRSHTQTLYHGISQLTNLRVLETVESHMSNDSISTLSRLEFIQIYHNNKITDAGLSKLVQLKGMAIHGPNNINGQCFPHMTQLKYLDLDGTTLQDDAINLLPPSLRILHSNSNYHLTSSSISSLTQLSSLSLNNTKGLITNDCIEKLTQLRSLYMDFMTGVTVCLKNITSWTNLRHLYMPCYTQDYESPPHVRISRGYDDFIDASESTFSFS